MKLTEILPRDCIRVVLQAKDKTQAITELVELLAEGNHVTNRDEVLRAVLDREATRPTAVGHGLAVPHGKCAGSPKLVMAIGRPAEPIDFGSKDGEPINLIVLVCSPADQTGPHIQALARIARLILIEKFRNAINQAQTADEIFEIIARHET
ncbi:MAG: PTS sugar transporter subunit IIA [Phycisphaerales bacterium]|nr:MAG: PTS sugar transporter subunit IIA [Phycisphaerales bacterium]